MAMLHPVIYYLLLYTFSYDIIPIKLTSSSVHIITPIRVPPYKNIRYLSIPTQYLCPPTPPHSLLQFGIILWTFFILAIAFTYSTAPTPPTSATDFMYLNRSITL